MSIEELRFIKELVVNNERMSVMLETIITICRDVPGCCYAGDVMSIADTEKMRDTVQEIENIAQGFYVNITIQENKHE